MRSGQLWSNSVMLSCSSGAKPLRTVSATCWIRDINISGRLHSKTNSLNLGLKHNIRFLLIQANCYSQQLHKLHGIQFWSNLFSFLNQGFSSPLSLWHPPSPPNIETANPYKRRQVSSNSTIHSSTQQYVCRNNKASRRKRTNRKGWQTFSLKWAKTRHNVSFSLKGRDTQTGFFWTTVSYWS